MGANDLQADLLDWLRIPSVSTGGGDASGLATAADWAARRIRSAGGAAEVTRPTAGNPLVVGGFLANRHDAPTILICGHYDVQGPEPLGLWETPPFEPTIRDGRIYARGASDDKGGFLPLLHVVCELARAKQLPLNVRVLIEGDEETLAPTAETWLRSELGGADCALVFDGEMADPLTPALTTSVRGLVQLHIDVRTARADLHSGDFGGGILNAVHVLHSMFAKVLPAADGRLRPELRSGLGSDPRSGESAWHGLPGGDELIASVGARPLHPHAGVELHDRRASDAALDVGMISAGEPRAMIPATAQATVTMRLAPGQRAAEIAETLERLLRLGAPTSAELEISRILANPAAIDADGPAMRIAAAALERACGAPTALLPAGGSARIIPALNELGIPVVLTGFALPHDRPHGPNESFSLRRLALAQVAASELIAGLADLPARPDRTTLPATGQTAPLRRELGVGA